MATPQGLVADLNQAILSAATATGPGSAFAMPYRMQTGFIPGYTWTIITNGTITGLTVNLEGSDDGVNWFTLDTYTGTVSAMQHVANKPVHFVRANVTTLTGGGNVTINIAFGGD
ncbi:MAG: hypothetical protein KGI66_01060 [Patescibacteria group bacterium]|nr:hypothetical protein [Patescibacteria group bacterium]